MWETGNNLERFFEASGNPARSGQPRVFEGALLQRRGLAALALAGAAGAALAITRRRKAGCGNAPAAEAASPTTSDEQAPPASAGPAPAQQTISSSPNPGDSPARRSPEHPGRPQAGPDPEHNVRQTGKPSEHGPSARSVRLTPTPCGLPMGHVRLDNAHLSLENDGQGHERCIGRVTIVNNGPCNVMDYSLDLEVLGLVTPLLPFEGDPDLPSPVLLRHILPGGFVDVPAMTTELYPAFSPQSLRHIILTASIDGPPYTITARSTLA